MKHNIFQSIKDFYLAENTIEDNKIELTNPELNYTEFFRIFNVFNNKLPENIDRSLFDKSKYYGEIISVEDNNFLDKNKNKNPKIIKSRIEKKWGKLIDYIYKKFNDGEKIIVDKDFLKNVYFGEKYKSNTQSFHNFLKNPKYLNSIKDNDLSKYYKKSFEWFEKNKSKIPMITIIKIENNYYLAGGNRRLSWMLSKGIDNIPIWLIK